MKKVKECCLGWADLKLVLLSRGQRGLPGPKTPSQVSRGKHRPTVWGTKRRTRESPTTIHACDLVEGGCQSSLLRLRTLKISLSRGTLNWILVSSVSVQVPLRSLSWRRM